MTDRIDSIAGAGNPVTARQSQQAQPQASGAPSTAAQKGSGDVVNLTTSAEALATIQKEISESAPIDREKVSAIKRAIAAGDYQPDAERVASKFIEIENALGKL